MRTTKVSAVVRGVIGLLGLVAITGCEAPVEPAASIAPTPFIVSNPQRSAPGTEVVYIALPAGALPSAVSATIRVQSTGRDVTASVADGGLDPVPVLAAAGGVLDVRVGMANGQSPLAFLMTVPIFARPIVVRTSPADGKRDVPLNATVVVVFSEPMDPGTLTRSSVVLRTGATLVPGQVTPATAPSTSVTFTPDGPLDPGTEYDLELTRAIRDQDGESLESPVTVRFTTAGQLARSVAGTIAFARVSISDANLMWYRDGRTSRIEVPGVSKSIQEPDWSPDGTRLAADLVSGSTLEQDGGPPEFTGDIILITPAANGGGATWRQLTRDGLSRSPTWAPDGRRIAFVSGRASRSHIYVMDTASGAVVRLTAAEGHYGNPRWSPNGHLLAFRFEQHGDSEIFVIRIDGTGLTNVSRNPADDTGPNWSPDGTRLTFESERVGRCYDGAQSCDFSDVFVVDANGQNLRRLTLGRAGMWNGGAAWSPDGSEIAFSVFTYANGWNPDGRSGIYVMKADGSNPARVTSAPIGWGDTSPTWTR